MEPRRPPKAEVERRPESKKVTELEEAMEAKEEEREAEEAAKPSSPEPRRLPAAALVAAGAAEEVVAGQPRRRASLQELRPPCLTTAPEYQEIHRVGWSPAGVAP